MDLKTFRRNWSEDQKRLRKLLNLPEKFQQAKELFFNQHAVLHNKEMSGDLNWSYADLVFDGLSDDQFRIVPQEGDHSLMWILWHISRIEDVTMNILVGDKEQVYQTDSWKDELNSPIDHTGNLITSADTMALNQNVNLKALSAYRNAVGRQTREVVNKLSGEELSSKTPSNRLDRVLQEGAVLPEAEGLITYWSRRKIFQLLLMPPTRHLMVHLNEAHSLRKLIK